MTSYTWKRVTGNWKTARDWTPAGGPPTASDSATINGSATFTVSVDTADVVPPSNVRVPAVESIVPPAIVPP